MSNTDVVREVDEEIRREQMEKLWQQYRGWVLTAAALVVAVVAGYKGWQAYQARQAAMAGAQFDAAVTMLAEGKTDPATKAFEAIAANGAGAYRGLAGLRLGAIASQAGKADEALARYDALGQTASLDPTLRGFAQIQAAQLRLDKADFAEMQTRLGDLAKPDGAWRQSARQLLGLSAYKAGKLPEAEQYFSAMLNDKLGRGPSAQIAEMMRQAAARVGAPATSQP